MINSDSRGETCLMNSAQNNQTATVELLIRKGANVDKKNT